MTWAKILASLAVVGGIAYGGWYLRGLKCDRDINAMQRDLAAAEVERANKAIADMEAAQAEMAKAATSYSQYRLNLKGALNEIKTEIARVATPLPADCKPDSVRVERLREAIDQTNTAVRR